MARRSFTESWNSPDPLPVVEAQTHPVRSRVLVALAERPGVTIREVAERLRESPRRVRHHVEALVGAGLVEVTDEENRRGVIERRYGAGPVALDDLGEVDPQARVEFAKTVVRLLLADLGAAASAGSFARPPADYQVRIYGEVDDACLEQLAEIHARAYREIRTAVEEGRERVRQSGEAGTEIISALFFFETMLWGEDA